jgi:hypothetical protein
VEFSWERRSRQPRGPSQQENGRDLVATRTGKSDLLGSRGRDVEAVTMGGFEA